MWDGGGYALFVAWEVRGNSYGVVDADVTFTSIFYRDGDDDGFGSGKGGI